MYFVDYNDGSNEWKRILACENLSNAKQYMDDLLVLADWDVRVVDGVQGFTVYARWRNRWR